MKQNKKLVKLCTILLMLAVFALTGCEQEVVYIPVTTNTLEVTEDGRLIGYIVESFEKEYYDIKELETYVRSEIDAYNEEKKQLSEGTGRSPIIVEKVIMAEDGSKQAVVALDFQSAEVYEDYMGKELFYGTVEDAVAAGYNVVQKLSAVKNGELLTEEKVNKHAQKHILIVEDVISVRTAEKVQYLSVNARLTTDGFVNCTDSEELKFIITK